MSEGAVLTPVADAEPLARFVLFSGWIRGGNTMKPDAFIPPANLQLSVTRHGDLSEDELWGIGQEIADSRPARLLGRADVAAGNVRNQGLNVVPTPQPRNHANIVGWPGDKSARKIIAQEIAAASIFCPR